MTGLHLPHLADRFIEHVGEGFWAGMLHRPAPPPARRAVPPAVDWPEWHHAYPDAQLEADIHGGEQ